MELREGAADVDPRRPRELRSQPWGAAALVRCGADGDDEAASVELALIAVDAEGVALRIDPGRLAAEAELIEAVAGDDVLDVLAEEGEGGAVVAADEIAVARVSMREEVQGGGGEIDVVHVR